MYNYQQFIDKFGIFNGKIRMKFIYSIYKYVNKNNKNNKNALQNQIKIVAFLFS